jgi:hypothetical protein
MTETLDIQFDQTGQEVYYDVPEGRPSSVSGVQVWRDVEADTNDEEDALGPPSVDSVNTTFDATAGAAAANPTKCPLTATTNIVAGRRYLATASTTSGAKEWVEVERIVSADAVYGRTPLVGEYVVGDAFQGTRISASLLSAWVSDRDNLSNPTDPRPAYRAVWSYVVAGVTYRAVTYFNLTRYPFHLSLNGQDLDRMSRGALGRLHPDDVRGAGAALLREASRLVRLDLWERELTPSAQRNNDVLNELIGLRALWKIEEDHFMMGGGNEPQLERSERRYWDRVQALLGEPKVRSQVSADGAAALPDRRPVGRR